MWRGGFRLDLSVSASFVWRCLSSPAVTSVSTPPSSNRAGAASYPLSATAARGAISGPMSSSVSKERLSWASPPVR